MEKNVSNQYYFLLEPSVFVFERKNEVLFYDSVSKKRLCVEKNDKIGKMLETILSPDSMYGTPVTGEDLNDKAFQHLIVKLREQYMGDLFPLAERLPVVVPPFFKSHADMRAKDENQEEDTMLLLNELTFYLNGVCRQECAHCKEYVQQFTHCFKNEGELEFDKVKNLIGRVLPIVPSLKLNFCGGNVLAYSQIERLFSFLSETQIRSNLYIHYLNWEENRLKDFPDCNLCLHIMVHFPVQWEQIEKIITQGEAVSERCHFSFVVESEKDIEALQSKESVLECLDYSIQPFYNGHNVHFFEQYVYMHENDFVPENLPGKREVYKRQVLNLNDMGKLTVSSKGEYYANMNFPPLGELSDDINRVVTHEWNEGMCWKRVRKEKPCSECVYQYLCPSPSNYELVIGKYNLCTIR